MIVLIWNPEKLEKLERLIFGLLKIIKKVMSHILFYICQMAVLREKTFLILQIRLQNWLKTKVFLLLLDRKSTRLNSSHVKISYAVFCLKKKRENNQRT